MMDKARPALEWTETDTGITIKTDYEDKSHCYILIFDKEVEGELAGKKYTVKRIPFMNPIKVIFNCFFSMFRIFLFCRFAGRVCFQFESIIFIYIISVVPTQREPWRYY